MLNEIPVYTLPSTSSLLVSGGDTRITLNPASGQSIYGCRPYPDPTLIALGSSTASAISAVGFAAADALRQTWLDHLQYQSPAAVYRAGTDRLRSELLAQCELSPLDGVDAILAASGTDLHLLTAQWLRPQCTVMVAPAETGSGVPAAVQGQHFNRRAACGGDVSIGALVSEWHGELFTLSPRAVDGSLRDNVDAECIACVSKAVAAGRRVLLILTDVSKTGLITPSVDTVLGLKQRWPTEVEVLVDACQFRLAAKTVRAYLAQGCMVALTGSKFFAGPSFCGALLVPPATVARYKDCALSAGARIYSDAADWPLGWNAARYFPTVSNFGLLLRWEAAIEELRAFCALPNHVIQTFLQHFAKLVRERLEGKVYFESLPVAALTRGALTSEKCWDIEQTIFSLVLYVPSGPTARRPLRRDETEWVYQRLLNPEAGSGARRFQLGQPVPCGYRDGVPVSALRLCVSAPMIVAACQPASLDTVSTDALAALDQIAIILSSR